MNNPLKQGELHNWRKKCKCYLCGFEADFKGLERHRQSVKTFLNNWICINCSKKLKYNINDIVWFLKYNKDLDKLEVICGKIIYIKETRVKTYAIEYHIADGPFKRCDVYEDYIFATKDECVAYGNIIGEVASDLQIQDLNLMKKQAKVYKQISDFLKSSEAIQFGVTGIDVRVENGYVNAEWKFGERKINDIK